jgi:hypothetical protein
MVRRPVKAGNKSFHQLPCKQFKVAELFGPCQIYFLAQRNFLNASDKDEIILIWLKQVAEDYRCLLVLVSGGSLNFL